MTETIGKIETALHLMNSMVLSGEAHSRQSVEAYVQGQEAATALRTELTEAKAEIERLRGMLRAERSGAVYVCPECDIAGCKHYRSTLKGTSHD